MASPGFIYQPGYISLAGQNRICYTLDMKHPRIRRWTKRLGIFLGSAALAMLLLTGGGTVWLWCWSWDGAPVFHESWNEAERAALLQLDDELRQALQETVSSVDARPDFFGLLVGQNNLEALADELHTIYIGRELSAKFHEQLHRVAGNGNGADDELITYGTNPAHQTTLAIWAALTGNLPALEALVAHGANPNTLLYDDKGTEMDTPLTPVINGCFLNGERVPWEKRRETADFLLQHGADINGTKRVIGLACDLPLVLHGESAPWFWALDHGKTMSIENLCNIVAEEGAMPVLERILREKRIDINDVSGTKTALQALLHPLRYVPDDEAWQELQERQIEPRLDMLLAAGVVPALLPKEAEAQRPGESDNEYHERLLNTRACDDLPADIVLSALEQAELPQHRELCQRILNTLRAVGAEKPASSTSPDAP